MTDKADAPQADTPTTIADVAKVGDDAPVDTGRPEHLPEDLWDAEAKAPRYEDIKTRLEEAAALKAEKDAATAEIYEAPDKIDWAEGIEEVDGQTVTFDTDDPFFQDVSKIVVEQRIPKGAFKALRDAFVRSQIQNAVAARAEAETEFKALGETPEKAVARIKGIEAAVASAIGEDKGGKSKAAAFIGTLQTRAQVEAVEALIAQITEPNPGGGDADPTDLSKTNPGKVFFGNKKAA